MGQFLLPVNGPKPCKNVWHGCAKRNHFMVSGLKDQQIQVLPWSCHDSFSLLLFLPHFQTSTSDLISLPLLPYSSHSVLLQSFSKMFQPASCAGKRKLQLMHFMFHLAALLSQGRKRWGKKQPFLPRSSQCFQAPLQHTTMAIAQVSTKSKILSH